MLEIVRKIEFVFFLRFSKLKYGNIQAIFRTLGKMDPLMQVADISSKMQGIS